MTRTEVSNGDTATPRTQAERTALAETRMVLAAIDLLNTTGIQGTTLVAIGGTTADAIRAAYPDLHAWNSQSEHDPIRVVFSRLPAPSHRA